MYARITLGGDTPFDYAASSSHHSVEFLLQHYRELIYESAGRRSLLTILEQGSYSHADYNQVVLKIGRRVGMDQMVCLLRYFVE